MYFKDNRSQNKFALGIIPISSSYQTVLLVKIGQVISFSHVGITLKKVHVAESTTRLMSSNCVKGTPQGTCK